VKSLKTSGKRKLHRVGEKGARRLNEFEGNGIKIDGQSRVSGRGGTTSARTVLSVGKGRKGLFMGLSPFVSGAIRNVRGGEGPFTILLENHSV